MSGIEIEGTKTQLLNEITNDFYKTVAVGTELKLAWIPIVKLPGIRVISDVYHETTQPFKVTQAGTEPLNEQVGW